MKLLTLLLFTILSAFAHSKLDLYSKHSADTVLIRLEKEQAVIDKYVYLHQKNIIVLAKVTGKTQLVIVKNDNWPNKTEYTYNILKDKMGSIIMIAEMPYSESGDWYIEYKSYFDKNGQTFAFSKRETVFDGRVKGGVAMEELFKYYNSDFKLLNEVNKLTDKDEKQIKRNARDFDFREYKYNIYKNVNDCFLGYNLPASIK